MKIFGVHVENSSVGQYRLWTPFDALNRSGRHQCTRFPNDLKFVDVPINKKDRSGGIESFEEIGQRTDLMVWQRCADLRQSSVGFAMRKAYGLPLVFECDDDLFSVEPTGQAYSFYRNHSPEEGVDMTEIPDGELDAYRKRTSGVVTQVGKKWFWAQDNQMEKRTWTAELIKQADGVTTTTETLARVFREYNPYVYVLPNCLDMNRWMEARRRRGPGSGKVNVAWLGGVQHFDDLKIISEVIPEILRKYPNTSFTTIPLDAEFWKDCPREFGDRWIAGKTASVDSWPEYLSSLKVDIMLAPLNSSRFNQSKSNIKWLEAAALGIPTVASRETPYLEIVDGVDGFLASGKAEWMDKISYLVESTPKRAHIGGLATKSAMDRYHIDDNIHLWDDAYTEIYNRSHKMHQKAAARLRKQTIFDTM